jgi:hypothetical protein
MINALVPFKKNKNKNKILFIDLIITQHWYSNIKFFEHDDETLSKSLGPKASTLNPKKTPT